MHAVSPELRTILGNAVRMHPAQLRVTLGIVDPTVVPMSTVTAPDQAFFSNANSIVSGVDLSNNYITLETGSWVLGRGMMPLPQSGWVESGFTSNSMSNASGLFTINPKIIINSTGVHSIAGLTFRFDAIRNNWSNLIIRSYYNETLIKTATIIPDAVNYVSEEQFDDWNRLEIEFTKTSVPYRRARMTYLQFGLARVDEVFLGAKQVSEYSPISDKLPVDTFTWILVNQNGEFRPGQQEGMQKYIQDQQPVRFEWGYPLSNGTIEWVLGGNLFSTGAPTFPRNGVELRATSLLLYMTDRYVKGLYDPAGVSLYDLAERVLIDAELPLNADGSNRWKLWSGLKDIYTTSNLPKLPGRDLLQIIANAGGCVFAPDRDGNIVIMPKSDVHHELTIDYGHQTTHAIPFDNPPLYSVTTNVYSYSEDIETDVSKISIADAGVYILDIEYQAATNLRAEITNGTIVNAVFYTEFATIKLNAGAGSELVIRGNPLRKSSVIFEKKYGVSGEILPFDNPLCTNRDTANIITTLVGDFYEKRSVFTSDYNGNILIDPLDRIWTENDFESLAAGLVIGNTIEYNVGGSWKGKLKWARTDFKYIHRILGTFQLAGEL